MRIYLAARYSRRLELCTYREQLQAAGHVVTSRWLDGGHQIDDQGRKIGEGGLTEAERDSPLGAKFAQDDVEDVTFAELLIAFTEEPRQGGSRNRGGRHVELGLALGLGRKVWVVGPRENVFCWLPEIRHFESWAAAVSAIGDQGEE